MGNDKLQYWRSYEEYLASREWALRREAVKTRCGGVCERCGRNPMRDVHHLTYERKFQERPEDLQAVCATCHEFLSGKHSNDPTDAPDENPYAHILLLRLMKQDPGTVLRPMTTSQLRAFAQDIAGNVEQVRRIRMFLGLDNPEWAGWWAETVLPQINQEIDRRESGHEDWHGLRDWYGDDWYNPKPPRRDIVEVVRQHVSLTPSGQRWQGKCPFHQENTPSFFVFPDTQRWRCFGACATGGDARDFAQRIDNRDRQHPGEPASNSGRRGSGDG